MHQLAGTRPVSRPTRLLLPLLFTILTLTLFACTPPYLGVREPPPCLGAPGPNTSLVVSNGVAYIGMVTSIAAIRTSDGSQLWKTTVGGDAAFATLAVD